MTDPNLLAEHIRLAMIDAAMDKGVPAVRREGGEGVAYVITYPDGAESRWAASGPYLLMSAQDALVRAYELCLILSMEEDE